MNVECPNCGFEFEPETERRIDETCPICKKKVENKLSHLRIDHDITSIEEYQKSLAKSEEAGA
jgi:endogenous inhibitor of DNA gyrase (YacG/DUF329 family)